jgi:hypothetical protein
VIDQGQVSQLIDRLLGTAASGMPEQEEETNGQP